MLSSIGRAAIRRGGAGASNASTNRLARSIWHLQRVNASEGVDELKARTQLTFSFLRSYATTTKTIVTPRTKTTKAKPKTKSKKPVKKLANKKVVAKKAKKPLKKKVLTEEQKTKAGLKVLKAKILSPPPSKPSTAWTVLLQDTLKGSAGLGPGGIGAAAKTAAAKYKSLTPAELESYNHKAKENKDASETAFKKWVQNHTPEQIHIANNARLLLKRKLGKPGQFPLIPDPRLPKRPHSSYILYTKDRFSSGDLKGISIPEAAKLISREWHDLTPSQRKPFNDSAAADLQRYVQEYKTVFHRDPGTKATTTV